MVKLTKNAITILEKRYLQKDDRGNVIETPEEMFRRVANAVADAEKKFSKTEKEVKKIADQFYEMMANLEFLPNSPTLMNAGRPLGQLSACFVLPIDDSIESIFEAVKNTALIHQSGGGTGFSFSRLRPAGDVVRSTHGVSSGPISFMEVFNAATEAIKQGGARRGANMGILRVDHPDILDFIKSKWEPHRLTNFNISVGLTKEFMEAVKKDSEYPLINPRTKKPVKTLKAREVFDLIVESAWKSGEPGIVFLDRINQDNPTPALGEIESTNPCGEQPLLPYESCNLGSINLGRMLNKRNGKYSIDWGKLKKTVHLAVRFLDNVIEVNKYPLKIIEERTKGNRKIGLGVMGFADMLIRLKIPYNSNRALKIAEKVMRFINRESKIASQNLANERGPFPNFQYSVYAERKEKPLRNATTTTIAPTGSIGIIAGASSGIEPLFAISYLRKTGLAGNVELVETNPIFEEIARERGFYSEELMKKIAQRGSVQGLEEVPKDVQKIFVTARDISPEWHVKMQAVFQKYVDNAVSKTVNFPFEATVEDVKKVYWLAYELGCKGVTVYRDRSRPEQVIYIGEEVYGQENTKLITTEHTTPEMKEKTTKTKEKENKPKVTKRGSLSPRPRPQITFGITQKIKTGCGNLYVTINEDEAGLCEVFSQMGKSGGCTASQSEAISRLVSLALRSGVAPEAIIKQLKGIRCPSPAWTEGKAILSCSDGIAKALENYLQMRQAKKDASNSKNLGLQKNSAPIDNTTAKNAELPQNLQVSHATGVLLSSGICPQCPECGSMIEFVEGCAVCRSCGYSRCV